MAFARPSRSVDWTKERIDALPTPEVRQLRANAERLNDPDIVERCNAVLGERPRGAGPGAKKPNSGTTQPRKKKTPAPGETA